MYKQFTLMLLLSLVGTARLAAMQDPVPIPVVEQLPSSNPIPRSPSNTRIDCEYDSSTLTLVAFLTNVSGSTSVKLENLDSGSYYLNELTGSGSFYLPFSGESGLWQITFTLEDGRVFVGEVEI